MNNSKTFKILYYISFFVSLILSIIALATTTSIDGNLFIDIKNIILIIINIILTILFSIKLVKKQKIDNINIIFPILFLIFSFLIIINIITYNSILIIPFIHLNYYISFILINELLLNIYSIISIVK